MTSRDTFRLSQMNHTMTCITLMIL